jgi:hypothetical protein
MENYNKEKEEYYTILKVLNDKGCIVNEIIIKHYNKMSRAYSELTIEELQMVEILPNLQLNSTSNNSNHHDNERGDKEEEELGKKKLKIIKECIDIMNENIRKIESEKDHHHHPHTHQENHIEENEWKNYFHCMIQ